jgi:hypothetical protein
VSQCSASQSATCFHVTSFIAAWSSSSRSRTQGCVDGCQVAVKGVQSDITSVHSSHRGPGVDDKLAWYIINPC